MYKTILSAGILGVSLSYADTFIVSDVAGFRDALEDAALNGESDTIILERGVYHTNSDGIGAFAFSDQEAYDITIEADTGLTAEDVVLDGDGVSRVFTYDNTIDERLLTLKNISLINGVSSSEGGCIYTDHENLILDHCIVSECKADNRGGAILSWRDVTLIHTTVSDSNITIDSYHSGAGIYARSFKMEYSTIHNNHGAMYGGGVYCTHGAVIHSTISNNSAGNDYSYSAYGGGLYAGSVTVSESNITNNAAYKGGGFYSLIANVDKSIISGNLAQYGAGFYSERDGAIITNSLFSHNGRGNFHSNYDPRGLTFSCFGTSYIVNNNFIDNEGDLESGGIIINNIFKSSVNNDLTLYGDTKLYNNYIDYAKINQNNQNLIKSKNLQPARAGDIKLWVDDLMLKTDSPAINAGLDPSSSKFEATIDDTTVYDNLVQKLQYDIFLNPRDYNNTTIDIGASEYGYANYPLGVTLTPVIMYLLN